MPDNKVSIKLSSFQQYAQTLPYHLGEKPLDDVIWELRSWMQNNYAFDGGASSDRTAVQCRYSMKAIDSSVHQLSERASKVWSLAEKDREATDGEAPVGEGNDIESETRIVRERIDYETTYRVCILYGLLIRIRDSMIVKLQPRMESISKMVPLLGKEGEDGSDLLKWSHFRPANMGDSTYVPCSGVSSADKLLYLLGKICGRDVGTETQQCVNAALLHVRDKAFMAGHVRDYHEVERNRDSWWLVMRYGSVDSVELQMKERMKGVGSLDGWDAKMLALELKEALPPGALWTKKNFEEALGKHWATIRELQQFKRAARINVASGDWIRIKKTYSRGGSDVP